MGFYYISRIKLQKDGSIALKAKDSNLPDAGWFDSTYKGTISDFLFSVNEGNFHLNKNKGNAFWLDILTIVDAHEKIWKKETGITFDDCLTYDLPQRNQYIKFVCDQCAKMIQAKTIPDAKEFGQLCGNKLFELMIEAKAALKAAKDKDKSENAIRISCAAWSIFEGYDLLLEKDNDKAGFFLAPQKDYKGGVLKTDPANIINLGKGTENLYAFLSFSGVDATAEELIKQHPAMEDSIRYKFALADIAVDTALSKGAVFREGILPYKGYVHRKPTNNMLEMEVA